MTDEKQLKDIVKLQYVKKYKKSGNSFRVAISKPLMKELGWKKGEVLIEEVREEKGKKVVVIKKVS